MHRGLDTEDTDLPIRDQRVGGEHLPHPHRAGSFFEIGRRLGDQMDAVRAPAQDLGDHDPGAEGDTAFQREAGAMDDDCASLARAERAGQYGVHATRFALDPARLEVTSE